MVDAGHFPGEEEAGGLQFAFVELGVGGVAVGQAFLRADGLFQPAPADDGVAEAVEVERGVGQGLGDLALHQVAEQGEGDGGEAGEQLLQRLAQGVQFAMGGGALASLGACDSSFAQNLANKMGVPVEAPTNLVWAYGDGQMVVAPRASLDKRSPL